MHPTISYQIATLRMAEARQRAVEHRPVARERRRWWLSRRRRRSSKPAIPRVLRPA